MTRPVIPKRKHHRLDTDLYKLPGACFITICTHNRRMSLGRFRDLDLSLSPLGMLADQCWQAISKHYSCIRLDFHIVMPNHIHGILVFLPTEPDTASIPSVINQYKSSVTRIARNQGIIGNRRIWQVGFWDHIVRDEEDLNRIREYIRDNPVQWHLDSENPDRKGLHSLYQSLVENPITPSNERFIPVE